MWAMEGKIAIDMDNFYWKTKDEGEKEREMEK